MSKKVFVVMMVKNEEDIIGYNIEWLQTQDIDHFHIADNMSNDNTKNILLELSEKYGNMTIIDDKQFAYEQSTKMNNWIRTCYEMGAEVIVPVDADEIWYSKIPGKTLGEVLSECEDDSVFEATMTDFMPHEDDIDSDNPLERMIHVRVTTDSTQSVAFTKYPQASIMMGNHGVHNHPGNATMINDVIGIKHYQYRNFEQFRRKMRNGKNAIEMSSQHGMCGHWRERGAMGRDQQMEWWENYISQPVKLYDGI